MKDIKGYEGLYAITSCGKVWSYRRKKFLSPSLRSGYYSVTLSKDNQKKNFNIHNLVANTYIPNPNGYDTIDHIDGDRTHNYINNLQWMTNSNNVKKANSKRIQCMETGEEFESITIAAKHCGVSTASISQALKNNWKSGGFHWKKI